MDRIETIINQLEVLYQSKQLSLTLVILVNNCKVDHELLEQKLIQHDFPVDHHMFIIDQNNFLDLNARNPDLVFIVEDKQNIKNNNLVLHRAMQIVSSQGIIVLHS